MRLLLIAALIFAPFSYSFAADGVLEINQTCAEGPGCFPGDEPGWPVRILNSGSYVLTSNLLVPPLEHGITTRLADSTLPDDIWVSLDLNGFSISSTTTCSGIPLVCSPTSTSEGFGAFLGASEGGSFLVHGGTVQGMATAGVLCSQSCVIHDLIVSNNGYYGLVTDGTVLDVLASKNGDTGIDLLNNGSVERSKSANNGGIGFSGPGTIIGNAARQNGTTGIEGAGSVLIGNLVFGGVTGITCGGCTAQNNKVSDSTNGIDFENNAAVYGGNTISATNNIINGGSAIQSAPNICGGVACP